MENNENVPQPGASPNLQISVEQCVTISQSRKMSREKFNLIGLEEMSNNFTSSANETSNRRNSSPDNFIFPRETINRFDFSQCQHFSFIRCTQSAKKYLIELRNSLPLWILIWSFVLCINLIFVLIWSIFLMIWKERTTKSSLIESGMSLSVHSLSDETV